ncbi:MAG TPA: lytic transglycosylase domain-containing protein [Patescibacteria group bacterium]
MFKHMFDGVKEGNVIRYPANIGKKLLVGSVTFGLIPLQILMPAFGAESSATPSVWKTELVLADETPELLTLEPQAPVIEKTASRYQEEQARLAEQLKREQAIAAQQPKSKPKVVAPVTPKATVVADVPLEQKIALAQKAAATYGIPADILIAVWKVESGMRWYFCGGSSVGARGPAQFMPGTWRGYGVDGNGDGVKDICHAEDAIPSAARYLAANGANRGELQRALLRYNNAQWYVDKVLALAGRS